VNHDHGSITPQVMLILIFVAVVLSAGVPYISQGLQQYEKSARTYRTKKILESAVNETVAAFEADHTPDADGIDDPAQQYIESTTVVELELHDISSKINPNYIRKKMLEQTRLKGLLRPESSAIILQQYRYDNGPASDVSRYKYIFTDDAKKYLTVFSWANINTTDEYMLRSLYLSITGSRFDADAFHDKISIALQEGLVFDKDSMGSFYGRYLQETWPIINAEPWFNVNFVDPFLLEALLKYPEYAIASPEERAARLIELREQRELTRYDIALVLGIDLNHPLMQYLGTKTSFWEIVARSGGLTYTAIIARLPEKPFNGSYRKSGKTYYYAVIEGRYEP